MAFLLISKSKIIIFAFHNLWCSNVMLTEHHTPVNWVSEVIISAANHWDLESWDTMVGEMGMIRRDSSLQICRRHKQ